jgi:hypothetical protein
VSSSPLRSFHSQPSFTLESDSIELAVTRLGGHMAPVSFDRHSSQPIRPYFVSPWQDEQHPSMPAAVLVPLRGDFFCLPFGGNGAAYHGQQHPPHGESATALWSLLEDAPLADGTARLALSLDTTIRPGRITKEVFLKPGHPVVYTRHVIENFAGPTPLGHHATLALPDEEHVLQISTSPFRLGMTNPGVFSDPAGGEYQSLAIGATFTDLAHVPSLFKDPAEVDCSRMPTRRGYADFLMVVADREAVGGNPAWTTAVNTKDRWVWFSLRDPAVLPATGFWIENRGRHSFPWNGRNQCLGLEDICGFFADGLVPSVTENLLSRQGIPTAVTLSADRPFDVRTIQGAVRVPAGFERVDRIDFLPDGIRLIATSGSEVAVPVRHGFVLGQDQAP